jgi:hypothetical protein
LVGGDRQLRQWRQPSIPEISRCRDADRNAENDDDEPFPESPEDSQGYRHAARELILLRFGSGSEFSKMNQWGSNYLPDLEKSSAVD